MVFIFTGIAHLTFMVLRSPSLLCAYRLFIIALPNFSFSSLMTQLFEFTTRTSVMLRGTLYLSLSCSSHRIVSFGCSPSWALKWIVHYSSLTLTLESVLRDILRHPHFLLGSEPYVPLMVWVSLCSTYIPLGVFFFFGRVHFVALTIHAFFSL